MLSEGEVRGLVPGFGELVRGGALFHDDAVIDNVRLSAALATAVARRGGRVYRDSEVSAITVTAGKNTATLSDQGRADGVETFSKDCQID